MMLFGLPHYLILVIPLVGALLVPVFGKFNEKLRDWTPAIFMGVSMVLAWSLFWDIGAYETPPSWMWIDYLGFEFSIILDPLSVIMAVLSSTLCFLIYVYSTEYMAHEGDRDRFFFLMLLFGAGMLTLVLSDNLLIAFIGWEIMGFCSYGLIGFWNDKKNKPETDPTDIEHTNPLLQFETEGQYNTHSGTKAFIVTRIGDAFMLAGILLLFAFTGTFSFGEMAMDAQNWWGVMASIGILVPTLILIFMGAIGKSGQAPLQVWLPEAMAGPTSVSALIHAATMVKAGIYITARFLVTIMQATEAAASDGEHVVAQIPAFGIEAATTFFIIVALIGGITALMTATMGMVSNELKQILAFSTLSQLGYMMLALGASGLLAPHYEGPYMASLLHVVSHGVFKALLFLASGGVIHMVHTKYITKMGGLKAHMRKTFIVMWIGVIALAGIPPLSGFWSKDFVIEYTYDLALHEPIGWVLFAFAVLAATCTIFYSIRLMGLTFYGPPKEQYDGNDAHTTDEYEPVHEEEQEHHEEVHGEVHDPGPAMMIPLYVLAAFTVGAIVVIPMLRMIIEGFAPLSLETVAEYWPIIFSEMVIAKFTTSIVPFFLTMSALALGGIPSYMIYIRGADTPNTIIPEKGVLRKVYNFFKHRWYINEFYYWVLYKFLSFADWYRLRVDDKIIDGIDFKSASAAQKIAAKVRWFDDHVVDGFAEGVSTVTVEASTTGQEFQTGRVNDYVAMIIFGVAIMVIIVLISMGVV
jgi:NADH-quinone oxidoreductase subunit L